MIWKLLTLAVLSGFALLGGHYYLSCGGLPSFWPSCPRQPISVWKVITDPDFSRPCYPSADDKFGLPPTFQQCYVSNLTVNATAGRPYACYPPNEQFACARVDGLYYIGVLHQHVKQTTENLASVKGVPPEYLYNQSVPLPYLLMYSSTPAPSNGPLGIFGLGKPETVLGNLHQAQLFPSNPGIGGLTCIPESGAPDMFPGLSTEDFLIDRAQMFNVCLEYAHRLFPSSFNPNWVIPMGHSYGGMGAVVWMLGNVRHALSAFSQWAKNFMIAAYFLFDASIDVLINQGGTYPFGGQVPLNISGIAFPSSYLIGESGATVLQALNLAGDRNLLIMPTNSSHDHYAPGQVTALAITQNLNQTWKNITYCCGYPDKTMTTPNTTQVYGQTMKTYLTYMENVVLGWLKGITYYTDQLKHYGLCIAQGYPEEYCEKFRQSCDPDDPTVNTNVFGNIRTWADPLFQFWDKLGGTSYLTRLVEAQLGREGNHFYDRILYPNTMVLLRFILRIV